MTTGGRLFHTRAAATPNPQSPVLLFGLLFLLRLDYVFLCVRVDLAMREHKAGWGILDKR